MPKITPIQTQFTAGELSPHLRARSDIAGYHAAADTMRNFIPSRHGPATRRSGTTFVEAIAAESGRMFEFQTTFGDTFAVVFTPGDGTEGSGRLYVMDDSGGYISGDHVTNGDFTDGLNDWTTVTPASATITWADNSVTLKTYFQDAAARLYQLIDIASGEENTKHFVLLDAAPFHEYDNPDGAPSRDLFIRIGTTAGGSEIAEFSTSDGDFRGEFNPGGVTQVYLTIWLNSAILPIWTVYSVKMVNQTDVDGAEFIPTDFDLRDVGLMQATLQPNEDRLVVTTPHKPPYEVTQTSPAPPYVWLGQDIVFDPPGDGWGPGNWPATATFFQGRSWWGGLPDAPETFYASKSDSFWDLDLDNAQPDDGIQATLNRRGRIKWMKGVKNLLIGTERGEFIVSSDESVITPDDIGSEQQSANGSSSARPEAIGNRVLYVSLDQSKLRDMNYQWTESAWVSRDLSFMSDHLGLKNHMREIHWAQDPNMMLWVVTDTGALLSCVYDPGNEILGWSPHTPSGSDSVVSACVLQGNGESTLWVLVDRGMTDDVGDKLLYVERMSASRFLESSVSIQHQTPSNEIRGVVALAGKEVCVLTDGALHPKVTLSPDGDADLNWAATEILIGLPYTSTLVTLPVDKGSPTGSGMAWRKRWNKIWVRLFDAALPMINGKRPPARKWGTPYGTRQPNFTGDIQVVNLGWDDTAKITIETELPFPCEVQGIFGELAQEIT